MWAVIASRGEEQLVACRAVCNSGAGHHGHILYRQDLAAMFA